MIEQVFLMESDVIVAIAHHDAQYHSIAGQNSREVAIHPLEGERGILLFTRQENMIEIHIDGSPALELAGCFKALEQKLVHSGSEVEMKYASGLAGILHIPFRQTFQAISHYVCTWSPAIGKTDF